MGSLKTTWRRIRRSPYQAIAAILIIIQTFIVVSLFSLIVVGSSKIINYFESKPQVYVFFRDEAKQEEINTLKEQLGATNKIASIKSVSKQEALQIYRQQNKDDPLLLDLVTADILPASLEISTVKISDLASISEMLKNATFVSKIIYQKDLVSALTAWTNALRKIGLALIIILALDSILIMVIIIGIKISQKREEIEITRLLGAGTWYVRWPFIFEGVLYGVVGAVIGWILVMGGLLYLSPFLESFLKGIPVLPISPIFLLSILGAELIFAIVLGFFASFLAVLRYLK